MATPAGPSSGPDVSPNPGSGLRQPHGPQQDTPWHRLDRFLARLRPRREPLSLLVDGLVIAIAWNVTYLFRLGFDRWWSARPAYDHWVLLGIVTAYLAAFALARVPQGMWRFAGFGDIRRLTLACAARQVLANGLELLGVSAPEKM
jgi:hypothetical protein